jgi:SAM-dependent methyltransferase
MAARHDLFGERAREYARTRPTYPDALFDHLLSLVPARRRAWDCGAGSGQTSRSLAARFETVLATDTSVRQLAEAMGLGPGVHRIAAAAEAAPFRGRSVDLVTVSAAIHWFDRPRFFGEVRRVARPGAVLAVWSYYHARIDDAVDAVLKRYADGVVASFWPAGMQLNRDGYRDLELPFERLEWPGFEAEATMRFDDLCGFMRTWSATQAWQREHGADPVEQVRDDLLRAWGDPQTERRVRWPLHGAIGRITETHATGLTGR